MAKDTGTTVGGKWDFGAGQVGAGWERQKYGNAAAAGAENNFSRTAWVVNGDWRINSTMTLSAGYSKTAGYKGVTGIISFDEKGDIKKDAEKLEAEAKAWDEKSDQEMHQHHRWAQATTALQVSIALAAIALLTRKEWLKKAMYAVGAVGVVIGGAAVMHL